VSFLEAKGLFKRFKRVEAVKDVSFTLARGESLGLVGESGSGKSTLSRLVTRLMDADRGKLFFEGADISRRSQGRLSVFRQKVQIVFQNPFSSFDPRRTLGYSIAEALRLNSEKDDCRFGKRVEDLLKQVELPEQFATRYPHQVSGGECQRAAVARSLARDPELLVCDEPVSSLDLLAQARMLNLFVRLQKERGLGLLFISHDLRVVRHLCDRVLVMKDGILCEEGPLSQVFDNPQHPYTQELLRASGLRPPA
jgi:peptide/nickel transport system ATP-binding protein